MQLFFWFELEMSTLPNYLRETPQLNHLQISYRGKIPFIEG